MSVRALIVVVVLWASSLFAVAAVARGQAYAFEKLPEPIIVSGSDLAFRVEGRVGTAPVGRVVIRMGGQWVEVGPTPNTRPLPLSKP
jgi:hypothetical protein